MLRPTRPPRLRREPRGSPEGRHDLREEAPRVVRPRHRTDEARGRRPVAAVDRPDAVVAGVGAVDVTEVAAQGVAEGVPGRTDDDSARGGLRGAGLPVRSPWFLYPSRENMQLICLRKGLSRHFRGPPTTPHPSPQRRSHRGPGGRSIGERRAVPSGVSSGVVRPADESHSPLPRGLSVSQAVATPGRRGETSPLLRRGSSRSTEDPFGSRLPFFVYPSPPHPPTVGGPGRARLRVETLGPCPPRSEYDGVVWGRPLGLDSKIFDGTPVSDRRTVRDRSPTGFGVSFPGHHYPPRGGSPKGPPSRHESVGTTGRLETGRRWLHRPGSPPSSLRRRPGPRPVSLGSTDRRGTEVVGHVGDWDPLLPAEGPGRYVLVGWDLT